MKPPAFRYVDPQSVADAVGHLQEHGGGAKILAGGQSLLPLMNLRTIDRAVSRMGRPNETTGIATATIVEAHTCVIEPNPSLLNKYIVLFCISVSSLLVLLFQFSHHPKTTQIISICMVFILCSAPIVVQRHYIMEVENKSSCQKKFSVEN